MSVTDRNQFQWRVREISEGFCICSGWKTFSELSHCSVCPEGGGRVLGNVKKNLPDVVFKCFVEQSVRTGCLRGYLSRRLSVCVRVCVWFSDPDGGGGVLGG